MVALVTFGVPVASQFRVTARPSVASVSLLELSSMMFGGTKGFQIFHLHQYLYNWYCCIGCINGFTIVDGFQRSWVLFKSFNCINNDLTDYTERPRYGDRPFCVQLKFSNSEPLISRWNNVKYWQLNHWNITNKQFKAWAKYASNIINQFVPDKYICQ